MPKDYREIYVRDEVCEEVEVKEVVHTGRRAPSLHLVRTRRNHKHPIASMSERAQEDVNLPEVGEKKSRPTDRGPKAAESDHERKDVNADNDNSRLLRRGMGRLLKKEFSREWCTWDCIQYSVTIVCDKKHLYSLHPKTAGQWLNY